MKGMVIRDLKKTKYKIKSSKEAGFVRDLGVSYPILATVEKKRREFGEHLTSVDIFRKYILPEIENCLYEYTWVDLFAGGGNLILPILELIPENKRVEFFKEHIFLFDIQKEMVVKSITNAEAYGIPHSVAAQNIVIKDTLKEFPAELKKCKYPVFHITNPPYLYLGYIAKNSKRNLQYFKDVNEGYQDLYQIALINDLRNNVSRLIYIIPTNFLFGFSVSNKIRNDFLQFYTIKKAIIFEKKIFEFTGTNVCICLFDHKKSHSREPIIFKALKINTKKQLKTYKLIPNNFYRAGGEFNEFVDTYTVKKPLKITFYLVLDEVKKNAGDIPVKLLDANSYSNGYFRFNPYMANQKLYRKLKNNPLFVRTIDTGSWSGRAGVYDVRKAFNVDGIVVTKNPYRTHPIQIFFSPELDANDIDIIKNYFNLMLEYLRDITDSEFLTTFKYSNSDYIRKYLGLSQTKKLLMTLPIHLMTKKEKNTLNILIEQKNVEGIKNLLSSISNGMENQLKIFQEVNNE